MKIEKIRILHVVTVMNLGGIETFLMTLYRDLDREKIQFDFLVHRNQKGFFDEEIKKLGGIIHRIIPLNPLNILNYFKLLKHILKHNKYNIIHSHLNANSTIVLSFARILKIKHRIAHSHIDQEGGNGVYLKKGLKLLINYVATERFACSKKAGEWLFGSQDFMVFKNSIKSENFIFSNFHRKNIREKLNFEKSDIIIGNIARFNKQKNHEFIIDVFNELQVFNKNVKLLLIGDGELKDMILNKIRKLEISERVILTGAIGNANEYLSAMDIFLFPSLFEGLGIVAIEAQTNGLPILMTDTIPKEVVVTDLIEIESLKTHPKTWAKKIISLKKENDSRVIYRKKIIDKGYDIYENLERLTYYYLNLK